jgi:hypothetical protein
LSSLPKINFREIREHETSQQRAFEELCYQLVPTVHTLPPGTRLERRQAPDGGIEFSCPAPDGKGRWAWQAKYLFNLNASACAQMDRSATNAIASTPDLRKYVFLLPTDRTGRASRRGLSGLDQWREQAKEWAAAAARTPRCRLGPRDDNMRTHRILEPPIPHVPLKRRPHVLLERDAPALR